MQTPARPFLKWAGSKKQLLTAFERLYPRQAPGRYLEPFLGSGAVFFHVQSLLAPAHAYLSDNNEALIEAFTVVRDQVDEVIEQLTVHEANHDEAYYYDQRDNKRPRSAVGRAARLIYLNKTCFNGLYRVNSKGKFNVPFGRYLKPAILDVQALRLASEQLRHAKLETAPFSAVLSHARRGDFVYLDPPYHPVSSTSYFTAYTRDAFGERDQRQLADVFRALDDLGCQVMLSNSDTPFIRELYRDPRFTVSVVKARRLINSKADRRGLVNEVVVRNYGARASSARAADSDLVAP